MRMLLIILLLLSGCATPLTEYERADREVMRLEAFYRFEAQCAAQGGMIEITRWSWVPRSCASRTCPPNRDDAVRCVAR